eukprot:Rmarinus@m.15281
MFFFFLASARPSVQRILERSVTRCPCDMSTASSVEYATVLRLFMIPVWTFSPKRGFQCDKCHIVFPLGGTSTPHPHPGRKRLDVACKKRDVDPYAPPEPPPRPEACRACGTGVDQRYRYCPQCGMKL